MALAERTEEIVVPEEATLPELVARANEEHALVEGAVTSALQHAINCGEALNEIRSHFRRGGWEDWLDQNFHGSRHAAAYYMRVAHYKDLVEDLPNVKQAMRRLAGMPAVRKQEDHLRYDEEIVEEARRLVANGVSKREVAKTLEIDRKTVARWVDPAALVRHRESAKQAQRKKRAEENAKKQAAEQRRVERAARKAGGALSEAYSLAHRLEFALGQAHRDATGEAKAALGGAVRAHHRMLDEIVKAVGLNG